MDFIPSVGLTDAQTPRRKQAVFKPLRMASLVALALNVPPPPTLVVQFDNDRRVRCFEAS